MVAKPYFIKIITVGATCLTHVLSVLDIGIILEWLGGMCSNILKIYLKLSTIGIEKLIKFLLI